MVHTKGIAMSGLEPAPRSPERLRILPEIHGFFDPDRGTVVTITVKYDEWCCSESHEVVDAIATVIETIESAALTARNERINAQFDTPKSEM